MESKDIDNFFSAVNSLKKYKRAEIKDAKDKSMIETLYTDLLPNNQVFKMCFSDNTTFLIGRKGTGKSTIILKLEKEYRKKKDYLPCYIDTKTVFESVKGEYQKIDYLKGKIPEEHLENYLIERAFIKNVLKAIGQELSEKADTFFGKVKGILVATKRNKVKQKISNLIIKIDNNQYLKEIELPVVMEVNNKLTNSSEVESGRESKLGGKIKGEVSSNPLSKAEGEFSGERKKTERDKVNDGWEKQFSQTLMKVFQINSVIEDIKEILDELEVKKLVIFLDDFSEVAENTIKNFVNVVLAPLSNWATDFICFKVAAYPNRVIYGEVDVSKIDIVQLDFYNLYSSQGKVTMESLSIDFTKRLILQRIKTYCNKNFEYYFDTNSSTIDEYCELLFKVSMNVPRIIGYILYYCQQTHVSLGRKITKQAIENAAVNYYNQVVSKFFDITTHSLMSFSEKASELQQKELLNLFVTKMKHVKKQITSGELSGNLYRKDRTNPFCSHFHFEPNLEHFIRTLELNFFITKYSEMVNKKGVKVSVYGLNYGLSKGQSLRWGRREGASYRTYFIESPFDLNKDIEDFLKESKRVVCINPQCDKTYPYEDLKFLAFNKMRCVECQSPVEVESFSESISEEISKLEKAKLLPQVELMILYELNASAEGVIAREIAEELDVSWQLIAKRAEKLERKNYVFRDKSATPIKYSITSKAKREFFFDEG
ncbi:hypothetical protein SMC37_004264 [Cronobacter sakazakii]|uniref:hypothetical protein n=1 Tax=Cronobacter sakazakii TaxID=28141 RepID=UPI0028950EF2|nr:hypothetical protein [Cronobacter sakazakii]ELY2734924.1 hypothetical protein [Cronobacter sakazakii]MDT3554368.1 hypothetical protein [Cronobacter sakazakii]